MDRRCAGGGSGYECDNKQTQTKQLRYEQRSRTRPRMTMAGDEARKEVVLVWDRGGFRWEPRLSRLASALCECVRVDDGTRWTDNTDSRADAFRSAAGGRWRAQRYQVVKVAVWSGWSAVLVAVVLLLGDEAAAIAAVLEPVSTWYISSQSTLHHKLS